MYPPDFSEIRRPRLAEKLKYSQKITAVTHGMYRLLHPAGYLADILDRIHDHKINRLDEILPWNWAPLNAAHAEAT